MSLKKILIKTKRQVYSEIAGSNPSIFKGDGFDFVELKEYAFGDDIRKIDWKTTAKKQKPFVKVFREERELNILIAPFLTGGVLFGTQRSKQEVITECAAILGFSCVKNSDRFALAILSDKIESISKPTKRLFGVQNISETIYNFQPYGKKAHYHDALTALYKQQKRKSIIFLIGDFFDTIDISKLCLKHEVILIIIRDHLEEDLFESEYLNFIDPESQDTITSSISKSDIKNYKNELAKRDHNLYHHLKKHGVNFIKIYTNDDPYSALRKLFL